MLDETHLPLLDGDKFARDRDRVLLGALRLSKGDVASLAEWLALAARDWRDLLVSAEYTRNPE